MIVTEEVDPLHWYITTCQVLYYWILCSVAPWDISVSAPHFSVSFVTLSEYYDGA